MKIIITFFTITILLIFVSYFILGNYLYVVANKNIPIYTSLEESMKVNGKTIGVLKKGDELQITVCHDVKHYIVTEIELQNGEHGFINDNFTLRKERADFTFFGNKIFSCP